MIRWQERRDGRRRGMSIIVSTLKRRLTGIATIALGIIVYSINT